MNMTVAEFRKGAMSTWSGKTAKVGVRAMARKLQTLNLGHAVVGVAAESMELLDVLSDYLMGTVDLKHPELQERALDELSDVVYYTVILAKFLKVQLPSIRGRRKPPGTVSRELLELSACAGSLLSKYKKMYYGQEFDQTDMAHLTVALVDTVWNLSWMMLGRPIGDVMQYNNEKLLTGPNARYKSGQFTTAAIEAKDKADAAKAKPKAVKTKPVKVVKPVPESKPVAAAKAKPKK